MNFATVFLCDRNTRDRKKYRPMEVDPTDLQQETEEKGPEEDPAKEIVGKNWMNPSRY